MSKSLQKILLVGVGNVFNAALGFAFIFACAKTLGQTTYFGKYALLATLLVAISKLIDFGTNSVYVAKSISTDDTSLLNVFYTLKIILLAVSIPISVAILYAFKLNSFELLLFFVLGLVAYTINYTLNPIFQKMEKFFQLVLLNTLPALVKGTFAFLIILKIVQLNFSQAFGVFSLSLFSSAFMLLFLPKDYKHFKFGISKTWEILKESAPGGVSQLIYEGWSSISNAVAKIAKDFSNVGIYSIADKITNIVLLASVSVFTVLLPKNAYRKKQKLGYDFNEIFLLSFLILIASFFGFFACKLFILRFLSNFSESIPLLGISMLATAFTSIHTFMEHYFYIEEKTNYIMYVNVGKLAIFLISASILTTMLSLRGLALANLIAAFAALTATAIFVVRNQKRKSLFSK